LLKSFSIYSISNKSLGGLPSLDLKLKGDASPIDLFAFCVLGVWCMWDMSSSSNASSI